MVRRADQDQQVGQGTLSFSAAGPCCGDEAGPAQEILAINTDITERKQLEVNFLRAQRMEGIGALAGGIAHDLNNILQPILMTAPLLRETTSDPENRGMLDTVESCAQRGADIIKQLLTFPGASPARACPCPCGTS